LLHGSFAMHQYPFVEIHYSFFKSILSLIFGSDAV